MITPFISLYTSGIKDANYYQPIFAIIIVIAYLFTCLQRITMIMTFTKGHFKKTMPIDITSTVLTVSLSVGLTIPLGIIGAAIGLLCGEVYRAFAYANYSSNNLLQRDKFYFVKRVLFLLMGIFLVFAFSYVLPKAITWSIWILDCFLCAVVSTVLALIIEFIFYKRDLNHSVQIITQMFLKK